jgi:hypothetical protein
MISKARILVMDGRNEENRLAQAKKVTTVEQLTRE